MARLAERGPAVAVGSGAASPTHDAYFFTAGQIFTAGDGRARDAFRTSYAPPPLTRTYPPAGFGRLAHADGLTSAIDRRPSPSA